MTEDKDRKPLGSRTFNFACNDTIPCFTRCCHSADMLLYPYDIIRLKQNLSMGSEEFLIEHTVTAFRESPNFPSVMLRMSDKEGQPCSFLTDKGCSVYPDRPYSCRAYPLEPAMSGDGKGGSTIESFLVRHDHCLGHDKGEDWTAGQYMSDQGMTDYNEHNRAWARVAYMLFSENRFGEKGKENPAMNMAFMASYNMNTFRRFVFESSFLKRFVVPEDRIEQVRADDTALMHLGFDWILRFIGGTGPLQEKAQ